MHSIFIKFRLTKQVQGYGFFIICILAACTSEPNDQEEQLSSVGGQGKEGTPVEVVPAEKKYFEYLIQANGKIESASEAEVKAENEGRIHKLHIKNGDRVQAGQVIAEMDSTPWQFAFEKAENEVKNREAEYESLLLGYSSEDREKVQDRLKISSGLADAEIALKEARINLKNTRIKAPISGLVSDLECKEGQLIDRSEVIASLYDHRQLQLKAKVLESELPLLKKRLKAEVKALANGESTFQGVIKEINPRVDESGMVSLRIQILSPGAYLVPGMNALAEIKVPFEKNLVVPNEAIVIRSGKEVVFVMENDKALWQYVKTGMKNKREIEITEGLQEGQLVIVSNNLQLAHEAPVMLRKEKD